MFLWIEGSPTKLDEVGLACSCPFCSDQLVRPGSRCHQKLVLFFHVGHRFLHQSLDKRQGQQWLAPYRYYLFLNTPWNASIQTMLPDGLL